MTVALGIRNNNPFNLRTSSTAWQGKIPLENNTGKGFEQFQNELAGLRAGMINCLTAQRKYKCRTIGDLIARHAPSNENDTAAYALFVAKALGADVHETIDLSDAETLINFSRAIIRFENGTQPYSVVLLQQAAKAALETIGVKA